MITLRLSGAGKYQELTVTQMWPPNFEPFNTAMKSCDTVLDSGVWVLEEYDAYIFSTQP